MIAGIAIIVSLLDRGTNMNLEQLMSFEDCKSYDILWYGKDIYDLYMDDSGLLTTTLELKQGKHNDPDRVYLIMAGITGNTCRYRFAIRLIKTETDTIFTWERVKLNLDEYANRIVFIRKTGFTFYNTSATARDFIVEEIWSKAENRKVKPFTNYDDVELSFAELKEIMENHYPDYYKPLSCVKGIYMIIDGNTGLQYVGSAYGEEGIWGRWNTYAATCHGNDEELVKLYEANGEKYFDKYKFIILQILPMKIPDRDVIDRETAYKKRFLTKDFGLNNN